MAFSDHDIYRIFLSTRPQIQRFLQQRIRCDDTAADLIQDIFLRLTLLKPPPASETEVQAWLFKVASNLSLDHLRTQKRRCELLDQYLGDETDIDASAAPERTAEAQDQLQHIQLALADLPDQCAEILYLSRIEGLSHIEIAKQLKISTSWVEKQLAKALLHCRQAVDSQCT
ncbi:RNA polymerase sigma factor [Methylomonas sp. LW13]|uniref:RNA polymerase sigma factor n=1 Tax=unclassified Methylomonas TaxID=2608980 RepID=UPI00051B6C73|nr:RNA polymerase sigma factor [Methylomonas sp. LW13]QBC26074.1 RNA polymerase sigma factor [Methylomonas sp. LW13]